MEGEVVVVEEVVVEVESSHGKLGGSRRAAYAHRRAAWTAGRCNLVSEELLRIFVMMDDDVDRGLRV